jgi:hypothetical protein
MILAKDNTPAPPLAPVSMQFDIKRVADLLTSAIEGGSNYWYKIEEFIAPPPENLKAHAGLGPDGRQVFRHIDYPLCEDGALIIGDLEEDGELPEGELRPCLDWAEDPTAKDAGLRCGYCAACTERRTYRLDRAAIERGLALFAAGKSIHTDKTKVVMHHFANWMNEEDDAETGDVFLQLCVFGEVKYS